MMIQGLRGLAGGLGIVLALLACSPNSTPTDGEVKTKPALPPEPVVNHSPSDAQPGERIEHGELILDVDEAGSS